MFGCLPLLSLLAPLILPRRFVSMYTIQCDIFGFGVTMVELFAGQTLFGSDTVQNETKLKER